MEGQELQGYFRRFSLLGLNGRGERETELLSSAGPERWGAMGAGWLMTTREASRGPAGEEPGSPRSHRP